MLKQVGTTFLSWIDERFPLSKIWNEHLAQYYAPKNFNVWYIFGSLALLVLIIQIISGIWLAMYYTPTAKGAFASVEFIMRDVHYGWLLRYLHSTGASMFFIVVFLHMFRGFLYGSHKKPRELIWLLGVVLYILIMVAAFTGYLLPWGQISYWAAQVIIELFSAVPIIGPDLALWVRGDFNVSGVTLNRFYALHVIAIPLLILMFVWMHIIALHHVGSNNPDGIEIKEKKDKRGIPLDGIPFHPYYTVKDLFGMGIFLIIFFAILFFAPDFWGYFLEHANFIPANPLQTPSYIAPVWYMTPFYAMLRAVPNKLLGVAVMGVGIIILFFLPWLDCNPVKSIRYRSWISKSALTLFVITFFSLAYLGINPVTPIRTVAARIFTVIYFAFFFLMPIYTMLEAKLGKNKPVPERVRWK